MPMIRTFWGSPSAKAKATSPLPVAKSNMLVGCESCTARTNFLRHQMSVPPLKSLLAKS